NCTSLESIVIPKGIKILRQRAFYGCLELKSVSLPEGLEEIDEYCFEACRVLDNVSLPEGTVSVGRHAFDTCRTLKSIAIPQSVKNIGSSAFINTAFVNECKSDFVVGGDGILIQYIGSESIVNVPDGVKTVGERAFSYKKEISEINLPDTVQKIGEYAFESCELLKSMVLPDSVTEIGAHAFAGCKSLENIKLSKGLTDIGEDVFFDTPLLDGCDSDMLVLDGRFLIKYKGSESTPLIPDGIEYIGGGAFMRCDFIKKINIPQSVVSIGISAFEWCDGLESVYIPDSVKYIGANAFAHCGNFKTKIRFNGEKNIGPAAFYRNTQVEFVSDKGSFAVKLKNDLVSDKDTALLCKFAAGNDISVFEDMTQQAYKLPIAIAFIEKNDIYRAYISQNKNAALSYVIKNNDMGLLNALLESGILSEGDTAAAVDMAIENQKTEIQTALLRYKHQNWGDSAAERIDKKFSL
ncbi:MAG: leucine-rich repeat domain-containing protein, partial [Firmicutes bacterium]|nr:leucine-rich repeat domain-containing protein [Bacillota bacterium]